MEGIMIMGVQGSGWSPAIWRMNEWRISADENIRIQGGVGEYGKW